LILNEDKQRELIHGYYASVSYIDAQIGRITKALKTKGLDKNTIIVIWGDHGFHLGDHNIWCKHSNFEQATRSPLLVYVPNITTGTRYEMPTELVDIFPTLCELTGLQTPEYLSGKSLVPALTSHQRSIKDFAISQYPRRSGKMQKDDVMGYSIRTEQYRYTEWVQNEFNTSKEFNESDIIARELYDYKTDPDETINLAENPQSAPVVQDMTKKLREFYETQKTKYIEAKKKLQAERRHRNPAIGRWHPLCRGSVQQCRSICPPPGVHTYGRCCDRSYSLRSRRVHLCSPGIGQQHLTGY